MAGIAPLTGAVSTDNVLRLLEHQRYRCALTGRRLTPETAALDHIVPVRQGGEHAIENTQVLHKDVNRAKGVLTNLDFVAMCREVVAWADQEAIRTDMPRRGPTWAGHSQERERPRLLEQPGRMRGS